MFSDILKEAKPKMDERLAHFREQIKTIRASRAEGSLVESIIVTYYGQKNAASAAGVHFYAISQFN